MRYYVSRNQQQYGPYTAGEIQQHLNMGVMLWTDQVREEQGSQWLTIQTMFQNGAAPGPGTVPPPPPPAPYTGAPIGQGSGAAAAPAPAVAPPHGSAATWPFHQPRWIASLWMPLMWWFVPPFGQFLSLGWAVEAIRRRGLRDPQALPPARDLSHILKQGFVVFVMSFLYFWIPLLIIAKAVEWNWLMQIWDVLVWIKKAVFGNPHVDLRTFLIREAIKLLAHAAVPGIYVAIAVPLFLVGRIRYALTRRVSSFFNLGNIALVFKHLGPVLLYLFLSIVTQTAAGIAGLICAATGIGVFASLLLGGATVWILASFAGDAALAIAPDMTA